MKIIVETIPHADQRYETVGDWTVSEDGTLNIRVSDLGNNDHEFLVSLHELIEVKLCQAAGVTQEQVDQFDMQFEADRALGRHSDDAEPGDDPNAPYRRQHLMATAIEKMLAAAMGVDWRSYEEAINAL